jgi:hypothetical protein
MKNPFLKSISLIFLICFFSIKLFSAEADSVKGPWTPKGIVGLNISQIAFDNWVLGGDNALTYSIYGNFGADYKENNWTFTNSLKLVYGQTKLGDADFKTNDNEIYLEDVLSYNVGWAVDPFFSNTIRSTLAKGYKITPEGKDSLIADFFDPGYITQSIGFTYDKLKIFKSRVGVAFQETFANKLFQFTDKIETDEIEKFRFETGIESVTDLEWGFMENMMLTSKLRLFSAFDRLETWDVRFDNVISAKINRLIVVNLNFLLVYEKRQSLKTQFKEALQLGISYSIF